MVHMRRPPSSAHIWVHCGSSPAMIARYPQPETEENREGTAAHEYLANTFLGEIITIGQDRATNGVVFTEEMRDGAEGLLADLNAHREFFAMVKGKPEIQVEKFLLCPGINNETGGTPDFFAVDWTNKAIYIWDYKFGHRFVPVYPNWQLTNYIDGIISYVGIPREGPNANGWNIRAVIGQPRYYHADPVREAAYSLEEHLALAAVLKASTSLPEDHQQTGDHCKDCVGRHACKTLRESVALFLDEAGRSPPEDLTPVNMGVELRYLQRGIARMEARAEGLKVAMTHKLKTGEQVQGFTIKKKYGRENWNLPFADMVGVGDMLEMDLRKEAMITPAQARKKFPKVSAQIDALSGRTYGGDELVEVTEEMLSAIFKAQ